MTLQQLEYIVAADKYRHFVKAATSCGITQSTLSIMIQRLEVELDVQIFDRQAHPIKPTKLGESIIAQAKIVLFNSSQLVEMVVAERLKEEGEVQIAIIPTIAPYLLPKFISSILSKYPKIRLQVTETHTSTAIGMLERAEIDVALLSTPLNHPDLLEIPIYYENFVAYISPSEPIYTQEEIMSQQMPAKHMWVLQEGHCFRDQILSICNSDSDYSAIYGAGSIDTLIKIVDENGGYTLIPELHISLLSPEQQKCLRPLISPTPNREISLVVRKDFVRERILNILSETIREIVPHSMVDERLKKFSIRL